MIHTNSLFYHRHHNHYQNKHFEHHHNPVKRNANKILTKKKRNHNQHRDNQSPIHIKINVKDTHTHTVQCISVTNSEIKREISFLWPSDKKL